MEVVKMGNEKLHIGADVRTNDIDTIYGIKELIRLYRKGDVSEKELIDRVESELERNQEVFDKLYKKFMDSWEGDSK